MSNLAIVILNYNGTELLNRYLPKLQDLTQLGDVILVDNASFDGSVLHVMNRFPWIKTHTLHHNFGYAGGYNLALKELQHTYFLILNNDLWISKISVECLLTYMQQHPECAAAQPLILSDRTAGYFDYAGAAGGQMDILGYPFCRGRILDTCEPNQQQYATTQNIAWVGGACCIIRRKDFETAGGFSKDFFSHMEEIDLCWRFLRMQKKLAVVAEAEAFHWGGGTLSAGSSQKIYFNYRNNLMMLFRNLPVLHLVWILPLRLLLDGLSCLPYVMQFKFYYVASVLKAHGAFYKALPKLIQFRKEWNRIAAPCLPSCFYKGSIVWDYLVLKKRKFSDLKFKSSNTGL